MQYRFVDHTADVEFIAYGGSESELVKNALEALFNIIAYTKKLKRAKGRSLKIKINAKGDSLEGLLWSVLQKTFSMCDAKSLFGFKAEKVKVKSAGNSKIASALILAREKCPECAKMDVKGISKYELHVKKREKFIASVVVDV